MPVPMSVMQAAVQGDKQAIRLIEKEYGVGDGRRYAENWLTEEQPPPSVPAGVSMDNLTNEQMDEFIAGKRDYAQGKGYPVDLAEEAIKKEIEFQVQQDVEGIERRDAGLEMQHFAKLKDAERYADMAEMLYGAGFTAEAVPIILGMGVAAGVAGVGVAASAGKKTIKGTFATAERMVKDPTLLREFLPYDRERIMKNLRDYRAHYMKQPEYVDVPGSYVSKMDVDMGVVPTATVRAKAAENILVRMGDEGVGARIDYETPYTFIRDKQVDLPGPPVKKIFYPDTYRRAKPVEGYEDLSGYLKRNVPKSTFGESKMGTRPSRNPTEVKGELEIPASAGKRISDGGAAGFAASMVIPGYDAYKGMEDAQAGRKDAQLQQQKIYEASSPEQKKRMEAMGYKPYTAPKKREYSTDYRYK